jgi:hypothetical protein
MASQTAPVPAGSRKPLRAVLLDPASSTHRTATPGSRAKTSYGPVASSCVIWGKMRRPTESEGMRQCSGTLALRNLSCSVQ